MIGLKKIGAKIGAIASSIAHETHSLMVMGFNDQDMALAANQVVKMEGRVVIVKKGRYYSGFLYLPGDHVRFGGSPIGPGVGKNH